MKRLLFCLVSFCGLLCGTSVHIEEELLHKKHDKFLRKTLTYYSKKSKGELDTLTFSGKRLTFEQLKLVAGAFAGIRKVSFAFCTLFFSDEDDIKGIAELIKEKKVRSLNLTGVNVVKRGQIREKYLEMRDAYTYREGFVEAREWRSLLFQTLLNLSVVKEFVLGEGSFVDNQKIHDGVTSLSCSLRFLSVNEKSIKGLKELTVRGMKEITGSLVRNIPASVEKLHFFDCTFAPSVYPSSFKHVSRLTDFILERCNCTKEKVGFFDGMLKFLFDLKGLQLLRFVDTPVSMSFIGSLSQNEHISNALKVLHYNKVGGTKIYKIFGAFKSLEDVLICGLSSGEDLKCLQRLPLKTAVFCDVDGAKYNFTGLSYLKGVSTLKFLGAQAKEVGAWEKLSRLFWPAKPESFGVLSHLKDIKVHNIQNFTDKNVETLPEGLVSFVVSDCEGISSTHFKKFKGLRSLSVSMKDAKKFDFKHIKDLPLENFFFSGSIQEDAIRYLPKSLKSISWGFPLTGKVISSLEKTYVNQEEVTKSMTTAGDTNYLGFGSSIVVLPQYQY